MCVGKKKKNGDDNEVSELKSQQIELKLVAAVRAVSVVVAAIVETVADKEHTYEAIADFRLFRTSAHAFSPPFLVPFSLFDSC